MRYVYEVNTFGRGIVLHFTKGEDILKGILEECKRLHVNDAIVTGGIGSLRKFAFHRIADTKDDPTNEYITIEGPMELSALNGMILDGEPHLHITVCDREKCYGGHMELGCEVQYLAEISLIELANANLTRRLDAYGISYIDRK